jgi:phosphoribosylamine--glycine ligase
MKVLILGGGGREHALAWKAAQSPRVEQIYVAPGNAGTALEPRVANVAIAADDIPALVDFARSERIDQTIVGPETPLVLGVTDAFEAAGLRCFGPRRLAARLEGSKAFTKDFLSRHRIPTAAYATFTQANFDAAWVRSQRAPLVVKADGLAAGKGVIICETTDEAIGAAQAMFSGQFGAAGNTVVIEEFLRGEEASFIAMVSGEHILPLATSQDHKRRDDGDRGPNTGFLYAGLMIAPDGTPNVLEFNCRFGDPETQPIMTRLASDLTVLCDAALDGQLDRADAKWDPRAALGVVLAAGGYPDSVRKGDEVHGLDAAAKLPGKVFHAGTQLTNGKVVTSGGRVLCAVGMGTNVSEAQRAAYALCEQVSWNGMQYRRDIGYRAIEREKQSG